MIGFEETQVCIICMHLLYICLWNGWKQIGHFVPVIIMKLPVIVFKHNYANIESPLYKKENGYTSLFVKTSFNEVTCMGYHLVTTLFESN